MTLLLGGGPLLLEMMVGDVCTLANYLGYIHEISHGIFGVDGFFLY